MNLPSSLTAFIAAATVSFSFSFSALAADSSALTKSDVPAIVKETLMNDPEIIMQALEKLRAKKAEEAKKATSAALEKNRAAIFQSPDIPASGASAADADVMIAEFFDYHCGYCKHFLPELAKVMADDKKLRVVFIDFPILSEDSVTAAKAALAVNRLNKDKYFEFHSALMKESGKFDEKRLLEIAKKIGIKADALKAEMAKPEVTALLDKNRAVAQEIGINGTPGLIIGNQVVPGSLSGEELKGMIAELRKPTAAATAPAGK